MHRILETHHFHSNSMTFIPALLLPRQPPFIPYYLYGNRRMRNGQESQWLRMIGMSAAGTHTLTAGRWVRMHLSTCCECVFMYSISIACQASLALFTVAVMVYTRGLPLELKQPPGEERRACRCIYSKKNNRTYVRTYIAIKIISLKHLTTQ